jgi:ATP-binding cassette subfamily B protein
MKKAYFQDDAIAGNLYDTRILKRLWPYLWAYKGLLAFSLAAVLLGMTFFLINPYLLGKIVDSGIKSRDTAQISRLAALYLLLEIFIFGMAVIQNYALKALGQQVMFDLRQSLFEHLQKLPIPFFDRNPVGRLVTRATNDVAALAEIFSAGLVVVIGDVFLLIGIAVLLVTLQPQLGLATLTVVPLLVITAFAFQKRFRDAYREARACIARVNSALSESIAGIRVLRVFGREPDRSRQFDHLNAEHKTAALRSVFYHSLLAPIITLINAFALAIVLFAGGRLYLRHEVSIGTLISFLSYTQYFFFPIRNITEKIGIFQSAMAAAERIFGLLDESPEPSGREGGTAGEAEIPELGGNIEFRGVSFAYETGKTVLHDISFAVPAGTSVAIVGQTGAGKTTIAALLNRFYDVCAGEILFDGRPATNFPQSFLRRQTVVIQQEVFLFSGTLRDNLRLGNHQITDEQIRQAMREAQAEPLFQRLPEGLDTQVSERGFNFSLGERQLLAFARAICANPRLLILDEATASIDTETEQAIQRALTRLTRGRTSLIIAHRLSTIRSCERILVLHQGRLLEQGTHDELMATNGYYARLYELQFQPETQ